MTDQTPSPQSVVVPVEPTEEMWTAARKVWHDHERPYTFDCTKATFRAMLAAAPAPSSLAGGEVAARLTVAANTRGSCPGWIVVNQDDLRAILAALSPEAPARERGWIARVMEVREEHDGFWRACSGCQESEDGHVSESDYPYSATFGCQPGGGCGSCGGLGVVWDATDYDAMADAMLSDMEDEDAAITPRHEAPDWTAATEAAWAENNSHEAPAEGAGDRLEKALAALETACERVAAGRSEKNYLSAVGDGQGSDLLALDDARRDARDALSLSRRSRSSAPEAREVEAS